MKRQPCSLCKHDKRKSDYFPVLCTHPNNTNKKWTRENGFVYIRKSTYHKDRGEILCGGFKLSYLKWINKE